MSKLFLIHGAGASRLSWKTFASHVKRDCYYFEYDALMPARDIIATACDIAKYLDEKLIVVGHSFGGVIGWHLANQCKNVDAGISIATPWGGSGWADLVCLPFTWAGNDFFRNVGRRQPHLAVTRKQSSRVEWLNVVATRGLFPNPPNDGVVTVESQLALCPGRSQTIKIHHSHNEIMHSDVLVREVRTFLMLEEHHRRKRAARG